MRALLFASIVLVFTTSTSGAQDVEAGERLFKMCAACHTIGAGADNRIGPELNGLDGRKAGSLEGFTSYSPAIKRSRITWSDETFRQYIQKPKAKIPGT